MRVLVTGAAGFLGRNVLLSMPRSWEVVALYRPGNANFLSFLEKHHLKHVRPVACNLTDKYQVEQSVGLTGKSFHGCLALASNTSIPGSIERPVEDLTINALGLLYVLENFSFDHLVYLSSGAVYIGLRGLVGPTSALSPTLPYAISKLAAEHYIRAFVQHRQTPSRATIVRFFGAYGPYEPPRKLYTRLVQQFAFKRDPHFTILGDGQNYIDAMYIDDAVQALLAVLGQPPQAGVCCVDLGLGNGETVNSVVMRAAHAFGLEPQISYEGTPAEYIQFMIEPHLFTRAYGFSPTISLETGLKTLAVYLAQQEKDSHQ